MITGKHNLVLYSLHLKDFLHLSGSIMKREVTLRL